MLHLTLGRPRLFICTAVLKDVRVLAGDTACFDRERPGGRWLVLVTVGGGWIPMSCCGLPQPEEFSSETSIQGKRKRTLGKADVKQSWSEDDISTEI